MHFKNRLAQQTLTTSRVFFIWAVAFHHVIVGSGRDPTTSHSNSYCFPAERGLLLPLRRIQSGFTEKKTKKIISF